MNSKNRIRRRSGNTLILVSGACLLMVGSLFVGYFFINVFFVQNLLQKFADTVALNAACALNDSDRLGQMNNLVARCRELVYASRTTSQLIQTTSPQLQVLASQVLDEDRQHAQDLEKERSHLAELARGEAQDAVDTAFNDQIGLYRALLPSASLKPPQLVSIDFGFISSVDSNVDTSDGVEQLTSYDQSAHLVNPASGLYFGNVNAKLPNEDSDLAFNLSSLAAPANESAAPARLALATAFQLSDQNNKELPSAVKIVINAQVPTSGPFSDAASTLQVSSTAATNGALPPE
jgi:hypothetical protein